MNFKQMKKFSINYIYLLIWTGLILYASLTPNIPKTPKLNFPHLDKVVHFCMYFGMTFLLIPVQTVTNKKANIYAISISIAFGLLMELVQYAMQAGREASIYDAFANIVGSFSGLFFYRKLFEKTQLKKFLFKN